MSRSDAFLATFERQALRAGAGLGLLAVVLAVFEPHWLPIVYRLAVFTCLAPSLGSLILGLIHRTTGGQWSEGLAPFLEAGIALLPWVWLLLLPLVAFQGAFTEVRTAAGAGLLAYDGLLFVFIRFLAAGAVFFMLRYWMRGGVGRTAEPTKNARPWVGPAGLVIIFFTLTFIADDWLESLEPGWHSTAFPLVWMASQVVMALALALMLGLACGLKPSRDGVAHAPLGIDWGNLLLATLMFWVYVAFCQFLIIWGGNLPDETSWFLRRELDGWKWIVPGVAVFGIAVPFFSLLSRRLKKEAADLARIAGLVLAAQWAYLLWVIVPAGGVPPLAAFGLIVATVGAMGALFAGFFARTARRLGVVS